MVMSELAYHITMSLEDGRVIAPTTASQRTLARAIFAADRDRVLLTARAADTHLHLLPAAARRAAGELAWRVSKSLRRRLDLPSRFEPPDFKPIRDQYHLSNAFPYILRQDERHGIDIDPFAEASNLPDLLGLRLVGRYTADTVARLLPRIRPEDLARRLGIPLGQLLRGPISPDALEEIGDAAAAALGLSTLTGGSAEEMDARCAAVRLVGTRLSAPRLTVLLNTSLRTVRRLRKRPADPALLEAIARQLRLRTYRLANGTRRDDEVFLLGALRASG